MGNKIWVVPGKAEYQNGHTEYTWISINVDCSCGNQIEMKWPLSSVYAKCACSKTWGIFKNNQLTIRKPKERFIKNKWEHYCNQILSEPVLVNQFQLSCGQLYFRY